MMAIEPVGIQHKRTKGFNLQIESMAVNGLPAKYVGRPSAWGNPFVVGKPALVLDGLRSRTVTVTAENCLSLYEHYCRYRMMAFYPDWLEPLRNHNLADWCAIGSLCHRDVLLQLLKETEAK